MSWEVPHTTSTWEKERRQPGLHPRGFGRLNKKQIRKERKKRGKTKKLEGRLDWTRKRVRSGPRMNGSWRKNDVGLKRELMKMAL